jgi:hypothetical protein
MVLCRPTGGLGAFLRQDVPADLPVLAVRVPVHPRTTSMRIRTGTRASRRQEAEWPQKEGAGMYQVGGAGKLSLA